MRIESTRTLQFFSGGMSQSSLGGQHSLLSCGSNPELFELRRAISDVWSLQAFLTEAQVLFCPTSEKLKQSHVLKTRSILIFQMWCWYCSNTFRPQLRGCPVVLNIIPQRVFSLNQRSWKIIMIFAVDLDSQAESACVACPKSGVLPSSSSVLQAWDYMIFHWPHSFHIINCTWLLC